MTATGCHRHVEKGVLDGRKLNIGACKTIDLHWLPETLKEIKTYPLVI
jgi:hypothetical protein